MTKITEKAQELAKELLWQMREIGIELHENTKINVWENVVIIYIEIEGKKLFSSDVIIYSKRDGFGTRQNGMNFSTTGFEFSPFFISDTWRTIHAASILKNWEAVCEVVNKHCNEFYIFSESIRNDD